MGIYSVVSLLFPDGNSFDLLLSIPRWESIIFSPFCYQMVGGDKLADISPFCWSEDNVPGWQSDAVEEVGPGQHTTMPLDTGAQERGSGPGDHHSVTTASVLEHCYHGQQHTCDTKIMY